MENTDFDMNKKPIKITDIVGMLKRQISANERPYVASVIKNNNAIIDEFHEKVLKKICTPEMCIQAGQAMVEWNYFYQGKITKHYIELLNKGLVPTYDETVIKEWIEIFTTKDVVELSNLGQLLVSLGWKLISDDEYRKKCVEMWEKIYSKSDDPMVWRKEANNHPKLWSSEFIYSFWTTEVFQDVYSKYNTAMSVQIQPQ